MSSKLVKKGLDFVTSTSTSAQDKQKGKSDRTKKNKIRKRSAPYTSKKGKTKEKKDFTEENLQYFKSSVWTMKRDTYNKIIQNRDKKFKKNKDTTEEETMEDEMD